MGVITRNPDAKASKLLCAKAMIELCARGWEEEGEKALVVRS